MEVKEKIVLLSKIVNEHGKYIQYYCPNEIHDDWWCSNCEDFCIEQGLKLSKYGVDYKNFECPCTTHGGEVILEEIKNWLQRKAVLFKKF